MVHWTKWYYWARPSLNKAEQIDSFAAKANGTSDALCLFCVVLIIIFDGFVVVVCSQVNGKNIVSFSQ